MKKESEKSSIEQKKANSSNFLSLLVAFIPIGYSIFLYIRTENYVNDIGTTVALISISVAFLFMFITNLSRTKQLLKALVRIDNLNIQLIEERKRHEDLVAIQQLNFDEELKDSKNSISEKNQEKEALAMELRNKILVIEKVYQNILTRISIVSKETRKRVIEYYFLYRNSLYDLNDKAEAEYYTGLDSLIEEAKSILDQLMKTKCDIAIKTLNVDKQSKTRLIVNELKPEEIEVRLHRVNKSAYHDEERRRKIEKNRYTLTKDSLLQKMIFQEDIHTINPDLENAEDYKNDYMLDWNKYFNSMCIFSISHYGHTLSTGKEELPLAVLCVTNNENKDFNKTAMAFIETFSNLCYFYLAARLEYRINRRRFRSDSPK